MRSAGLRDLAYLAESRSYDVCVPIKLTSKRTFNLSLMCPEGDLSSCGKIPIKNYACATKLAAVPPTMQWCGPTLCGDKWTRELRRVSSKRVQASQDCGVIGIVRTNSVPGSFLRTSKLP